MIDSRKLTNHEITRAVNAIKSSGYTVINNFFSEEEADQLIEKCQDVHKKYNALMAKSERATKVHGNGDVRVIHNLHNKSNHFLDTIFDESVLKIADKILKEGSYQDSEPFQLALSQARGLAGRHPAQQLHIDSLLPGSPHILVLQTAWILNDFTEENGATRIVPNSQRNNHFAKDGEDYDAKILTAPKGSLLIFDGGLWHGSSAKVTDDERWLIINRYCRWFIRPSFDLTRNTPYKIYQQLTEKQREILGFRFLPPKDEFTRITRMKEKCEFEEDYELPI